MSTGGRYASRPAKSGKPGRTVKLLLEPDTLERLLQSLRAGNSIKGSCEYALLGESTYHQYLAMARQPGAKQVYLDFAEQVTRAEADARLRLVAQWAGHAKTDYRAARDLCAVRWPAEFAKRDHLTISSDDEQKKLKRELLAQVRETLGDEAYATLVRRLAEE